MEQMTPQRRELYFSILDGYHDVHAIGQRLYFLDDHFPLSKLDFALRWLVDNHITGQNFLKWHCQVCKNSDLEMHRILLSIVNNLKLAPVIAGKDFRI